MKYYLTLSEAMMALKARGYSQDFNLHHDWIEVPQLDLRLKPEEFHVDEVHRYEGMSSADDSEVLYAISSTRGIKGLLVDAYGAYSGSISTEMIKALTIDSKTQH